MADLPAPPPPAPPAPPSRSDATASTPPAPPPPAPPAPSSASPSRSPQPSGGAAPRRRLALPVAAVALALASGTAGATAVTFFDDEPASTATDQQVTSSLDGDMQPVADTEPSEPLSKAAAKVLPSVVSITAGDRRQEGEGSGVVISSDGLVLTNNHVVSLAGDGGDIEVTLPDGSTADATVEGTDPASDLAVIKVEGRDDLTAATLGASADLQVGDTVLAVGSPLGLDGSVTAGIVSARDRAITLGESDGSAPAAVVDAIQTDAAINPGNSGGALVNSDGEVVGINTAIASLAQSLGGGQAGNIGLGFAIPIDEARDIADQLVEDGEATHAYLGVQMVDDTSGATLAKVEADSPADEAGLREGDVVTAIDDANVTDVASLTAKIRAHDPGDEVTLAVTRDGDEIDVDVTLGTFPATDS